CLPVRGAARPPRPPRLFAPVRAGHLGGEGRRRGLRAVRAGRLRARASMDDLVITGAGVITSIGQGRVEFFEALCRGASGLGPLAYFEPRLFKQRSAYEIAGQVEPMRSSRLLGRAVRQALQDAGVEAGAEGMVVVVGTGLRELRSVELWHAGGAALRPERLHFADAMREDLGFA